jgi:OOP family OmpA-OmpF porin
MNSRIAIAVALACISSASFAQQNKGAAGAAVGPYAGISGGRSSTSFTTQDFSVGAYNRFFAGSAGKISESTDKSGTAWRIFYGYNFDANWALEGAYTSLGDSTFKLTGTVAPYAAATETFKATNSSFSLAVKGTLPVSAQFDIFALVGGTYNRTSLTRSPTGQFTTDLLAVSSSASNNRGYGMGGVGVEFKPAKNWGIRAEYQALGKFGEQFSTTTAKTGRSSVDTWLIGATFRF